MTKEQEDSIDDLVARLRKRAEIRSQISTRKSVQEGKPDRLGELLIEAAATIAALSGNCSHLENERDKLLQDGHDYLAARKERDEAFDRGYEAGATAAAVAGGDELAMVREVLNEDLRIAGGRVLTLELENQELKRQVERAKELQKGAEDAADYAIAMRHRHENLELIELDAQNHGADMTAEALHKILLTGRESGVFGGEKVEACAKAILYLRDSLKQTKDNFEEAERKLYLRIQELEEDDLYQKGRKEVYAECIKACEQLMAGAKACNYNEAYIEGINRILICLRAHESNNGPLTTPLD